MRREILGVEVKRSEMQPVRSLSNLTQNPACYTTIIITDAIHERMNHDRNDTGIKSEGEEDSQCGNSKPKATLGRTPNHLSLR